MSSTSRRDLLVADAKRLLVAAGIDVQNKEVVAALLSQPCDIFSPLANAAGGAELEPATVQPDGADSAPHRSRPPAESPSLPAHDDLREYFAESVRLRQYEPAAAQPFTAEAIARQLDRVTARTRVHALVEHPFGAFVEFPQTGAVDGEIIAHRFPVDPERPVLPHNSFQYSLGGVHGGQDAQCRLIRPDGRPVDCKAYYYSCTGIRACSFTGTPSRATHHDAGDHHFTSPSRQAARRAAEGGTGAAADADREVFTRTLAFFCALQRQGCSGGCDAADGEGPTVHGANHLPQDSRAPSRPRCSGRLVLKRDSHGHSYIRCDSWQPNDRGHFVFHNLQDYDIPYLSALLDDNSAEITAHEERAAAGGYGPLVACNYTRSCRSQAQTCPNWHRNVDGLQPGIMESDARACSARFRVYVPVDLDANPAIVVLCLNPHSHGVPERSMTPPPIREAFKSMLGCMDWKLADATPLRVVQDGGFMCALRKALEWTDPRDPTLADLHPSLGNKDHAAYVIDKMRRTSAYPCGTDFEGAQHLYAEQLAGPAQHRYVRFAERVEIPVRKDPVRMIICMSPKQSRAITQQKRVQTDIAFNRVKGFLEFEMVAWDTATSQSITLCRAFTECQSAEAHLALFRAIFRIVEDDTGWAPRFRHIHGDGIEIWTADEHKGQALGLGLFLVEISKAVARMDPFDPEKRICDLRPYEHLARFFRLCIVHFKRNIRKLVQKGEVQDERVISAMYSLASSEQHADFDAAKNIIRNGNPKAQAWLYDKEVSAPFALPALYQPLSKIPLSIWLAGASTSNGVEQAHRNVNRDGTGLPLVGGIQRGMQHDVREARSGSTALKENIQPRYRPATHTVRQQRTLERHARETKRKRRREDDTARDQQERVKQLQQLTAGFAADFQHALLSGDHSAAVTAQRQLRDCEAKLAVETAALSAARMRGSGNNPLSPLRDNGSLYRITVPSTAPPSPKRQRVDAASHTAMPGQVTGPVDTWFSSAGLPALDAPPLTGALAAPLPELPPLMFDIDWSMPPWDGATGVQMYNWSGIPGFM